jgi:hypothetical protein
MIAIFKVMQAVRAERSGGVCREVEAFVSEEKSSSESLVNEIRLYGFNRAI